MLKLLKKIFNWIYKMPDYENQNERDGFPLSLGLDKQELKKLSVKIENLEKQNQILEKNNQDLERQLEKELEGSVFVRQLIAMNYGVELSEVTDAFIKQKQEKKHNEISKIFDDHAQKRNIEMTPITPERAQEIEKEINRLIMIN